ncbi:vacuolar protein sorting-associated protein 41 homolog isoform X4 [Elaeis guineensis]|uniref:Vacuolar protein sorting-associated protein 41 homolog n=1 Tax=Elaeis guineensis var. tenera TaxID=51953 RepID=A0A6J0PQ78_ELAGV|nr:vacuolar protein sorting-associated protein 41 homolog isoform X3 [Elaeis guineensis]
MASDHPSENGADEREEDGDEEEEEEEEPRLKYQRFGGNVPSLLSTDAASSIAIAERMVALGTHDGTVHILDFQGNQVKEFAAHTATVNDLCFDVEGEYIGSCSDDGSVVINGLFSEERLRFEYHRPMKTITLDPDYSRKSSRRFVAGGLAGQLFLNTKNWLGYNKQVLHDGEGSIHAAKWRTSLIAWANDAGVKVYDMANNQCITFIERARGSPRPELLLPHLVWQGTAQRPEVRIVTWKNEELATDALPVHGYEHYKAKDYVLVHAPFTGSSYAGGQWAAGDEPLYYIVSPKDVVVARPRDAEDHVSWLLQHGWHEKALAAVEAGQGQTGLLDEVGSRYLDHLIVERKYAEAASLCPKLLRGSASAWERWVFHFAHLRQLPVLVPYMPTENPRLRDTVYEVALVALATHPSFHQLLLSTVKSWPATLYSTSTVISAIKPQLNTSSMTDSLKEALAELYIMGTQYEKAFSLYADLMKPEIFDFVEKHSLHDAIQDKVVQLMMLDSKRAVSLLVQYRDMVSPSEVVGQLLHARQKCDNRFFLHLYLHSLFDIDSKVGKEFHDLQVELYADYEPRMLLPFLHSSHHYKLEKAYEICVKKDLLREQAFILARMGNAKRALAVYINKLEDIAEAVDFVSTQHDDDLWEELIKQCLQKPEMVGILLEHTVGNLDPLYIVSMVPGGFEIPRLRDRLVKIITDYRTETSLRHGCNVILKADCVNLLIKYYKEARHAIYLGSMEEETRGKRVNVASAPIIERATNTRVMVVKSRTRGNGRCCLCFDPFSIQNVNVVVFFCCHAYHVPCLQDGSDSVGIVSQSDDDNDDDGGSRMRCVLCTTASG